MVSGKPISEEVQWIIIHLSSIMSREDIAVYTDVSLRKVNDVLSTFNKEGTVKVYSSQKQNTNSSLSEEDIYHLLRTLDESPDLSLDELRQDLESHTGKSASIPTIWRTLRQTGYNMEKFTHVAFERNYEARSEFGHRMGGYTADQLVFVDESAVDHRTTYRGHSWPQNGYHATRNSFYCRGQRFSVLPSLSLNEGIIYCDVVEGSFDTQRFYQFMEQVLGQMNCYPASNSVIVMDNSRIHKHPSIIELIHERGMRVEFLPPYSPDYNPIEHLFSAMKYHLHRNGEDTRLAMTQLSDEEIAYTLRMALYEVTMEIEKVFGWFRHCGYV